ncbi:hypothetical protein [Nostoc sp.]|uniref:hypothetical protein n=1 Tax=Nostoc sp. TaxID=1180 RepID=UPI002FF5ABC3
MSNINNQTQDLYSIELVQDLDQETSATVSGGALVLSSNARGEGTRRTFSAARNRSLGSFNNIASWYEVTGKRDWFVYTGQNFSGRRLRLGAGKSNNLPASFNDDVESARPV